MKPCQATLFRPACLFTILLVLLWHQPMPTEAASPLQKVVIATGIQPKPVMELAQREGFFAAQGLDVTLKTYVMGKEGLERMLAGECDFATPAGGPVAHYALTRRDFRIIASLYHHNNITQIVARKDRGILTPKDLRGKRLGVAKNTAPHFFADLLLNKHGIRSDEVTWVFREGSEVLALLTNDEADAISTLSQPALTLTKNLGRDKTVVFSEPGICHNNVVLVARTDTLSSRPEITDRLLRALIKTEEYLTAHPDALSSLIARDTQLGEADARLIASDYYFNIGLPHVLLLGMEDFARWSVENGFTKPTMPTNFLAIIDPAPLRRIAPARVNLEKAGGR